MGGGKSYAEVYSKYKPEAKFSNYVDKHTDLKAAWKRIQDDPNHPDSQYWIKRGATSKEAFGRAHAAEDAALKGGTYMGATKYKPGSDALKGLLSDSGNTRYETFLAGSSSDEDNGDNGDNGGGGGGGSPGDRNYPIALVDYVPPSVMEDIPLEFQPWIKSDHISDSIWNYRPPTLSKWESSNRNDPSWDWARKPASEYVKKKEDLQKNREDDGSRDSEERTRSTSSAPFSGFRDLMAALGVNSKGLTGQAGREQGLADVNAEINAAGGWDSPVG